MSNSSSLVRSSAIDQQQTPVAEPMMTLKIEPTAPPPRVVAEPPRAPVESAPILQQTASPFAPQQPTVATARPTAQPSLFASTSRAPETSMAHSSSATADQGADRPSGFSLVPNKAAPYTIPQWEKDESLDLTRASSPDRCVSPKTTPMSCMSSTMSMDTTANRLSVSSSNETVLDKHDFTALVHGTISGRFIDVFDISDGAIRFKKTFALDDDSPLREPIGCDYAEMPAEGYSCENIQAPVFIVCDTKAHQVGTASCL